VATDETIIPEEVVNGHRSRVPDPEKTGEGTRASSQVRKASNVFCGIPRTRMEGVLLYIKSWLTHRVQNKNHQKNHFEKLPYCAIPSHSPSPFANSVLFEKVIKVPALTLHRFEL
jgi:hypothetical protein